MRLGLQFASSLLFFSLLIASFFSGVGRCGLGLYESSGSATDRSESLELTVTCLLVNKLCGIESNNRNHQKNINTNKLPEETEIVDIRKVIVRVPL